MPGNFHGSGAGNDPNSVIDNSNTPPVLKRHKQDTGQTSNNIPPNHNPPHDATGGLEVLTNTTHGGGGGGLEVVGNDNSPNIFDISDLSPPAPEESMERRRRPASLPRALRARAGPAGGGAGAAAAAATMVRRGLGKRGGSRLSSPMGGPRPDPRAHSPAVRRISLGVHELLDEASAPEADSPA